MESNPWLSDPTQDKTASDKTDSDRAEEPDGIGNQINNALGDFDVKLTRLNEELESKRSELADLEDLITLTEKAQAKAFKDLLSKNPQIKKMLGTQKKKAARRRKPKADTNQPTDQADETPYRPGQLPPNQF